MTLQGLDRRQAQAIWQPFLGAVAASSDPGFASTPRIPDIPTRHIWDPAWLRARNAVLVDGMWRRPTAPRRPVQLQGRRAQPRPVAMGSRAVLGQGPQRRFRQYQRQGRGDREQASLSRSVPAPPLPCARRWLLRMEEDRCKCSICFSPSCAVCRNHTRAPRRHRDREQGAG